MGEPDPRDAEIRALQQQLQAKTEECERLRAEVAHQREERVRQAGLALVEIEKLRDYICGTDELVKYQRGRAEQAEAENVRLRADRDRWREVQIDFERCSEIALLAASYWAETSSVWEGTVSQRLGMTLSLEHQAREDAEAECVRLRNDLERTAEALRKASEEAERLRRMEQSHKEQGLVPSEWMRRAERAAGESAGRLKALEESLAREAKLHGWLDDVVTVMEASGIYRERKLAEKVRAALTASPGSDPPEEKP